MPRRIMVAGAIAAHPIGGSGTAWVFLQYLLGFQQLGFDTYYVEHIAPAQCIDDDWQPTAFAQSSNARYLRAIANRYQLGDRIALLNTESDEHVGLSRAAVQQLAADTDLFVNLSGRFHLQPVLAAARRRMYVDLDPGFVQIWHTQYGVDMNLRDHDVYVTVGLNLGAADCPMPTCGIRWQTTLPPVVLSEWITNDPPGPAYSTVADWRGYSPVEWRGTWYGQKSEEFLRVIDLPKRVDVPLELCLAIHPQEPDRARLVDNGWRLVSPREAISTPDAYRAYIRGARGEFTVVKHGYAAGHTGWFSDRSACYLAASRPVVMQETGISRHVPTGDGLLTFADVDGAAAALRAVESEYARHAAAAAAFAREHLDAGRVLARLLELAQL